MGERIIIITHWYNEELLAPLFLRHYKYVDKIWVLLETDTNDKTREILRGQSNVVIKDIHNRNKNDEKEMRRNINKAISEVKEGWIYMVDADEFIFPENFEDSQTFLKRQTADVVISILFHVYPHVAEGEIDYDREVVSQRVHALDGGKEHTNWFKKPNIFKATCGLQYARGVHWFLGEHSISNERYIGAHWKHASLEIAIRRRLSNMARLSERNKAMGYCFHDRKISEEHVREWMDSKKDLPVLPLLVRK